VAREIFLFRLKCAGGASGGLLKQALHIRQLVEKFVFDADFPMVRLKVL
jgi:hypothetical protein